MLKAYRYCRTGSVELRPQKDENVFLKPETHLLLGGVTDGCQGDEATDMLSVFLQDDVIPERKLHR